MAETLARYNVLFNIQTKLDEATADIEKVKGKLDGVDKETKKTSKGFSGMAKAAKAAAAAFIASKLVQGVFSAGKAAINAAADFETLEASFATLTGSTQAATALLKELEDFSVVTPFEPAQVNRAARTLLGFGRTTDEVVKDVKLLGEVTAATGGNIEQLSVVFGQVAGVGKLQGQDALQFINAGIPLYQILSESIGKSVREVKELQSQGAITFDVLRKAFADAALEGGKFEGALLKQSKTLSGLRSTLSGVREAITRAFGERILQPVKDLTSGLIELGKSVLDWIKIPVEDNLRKQQSSINALIGAATNLNVTEEKREKILRKINAEHPFVLEGLDAENVSNDELNTRLKKVNKAYEIKIELLRETTRLQAAEARFSNAVTMQFAEELKLRESLAETGLSPAEVNRQVNGINRLSKAYLQGEQGTNSFLLRVADVFGSSKAEAKLASLAFAEASNEVKDAESVLKGLSEESSKRIAELQSQLDGVGINLEWAAPDAITPPEVEGSAKVGVEFKEGSLDDLKKQLSEIDKLINESDPDSPLLEGYVAESERLKSSIELVKLELDSLKNEFAGDEISQIYEDLFKEFRDENFFPDVEDILIEKALTELEKQKANIERIRKESLEELDTQTLPAVTFDTDEIELSRRQERLKRKRARTEEEKEIASDRKKRVKDLVQSAVGATKSLLAEQVRRKDAAIEAQRDKINFLSSLQEGATDQQLKLEQERLEKLQAEREKAARNQQKIAALEVAAANAVTIAESIKAIAKGFSDEGGLVQGIATTIALAAAVAATIGAVSNAFSTAPSFYEGTEDTKRGALDSRGGFAAVLHPNERVVPAKYNKHLRGVKNADLPKLVEIGRIVEERKEFVSIGQMAKERKQLVSMGQIAKERKVAIPRNNESKDNRELLMAMKENNRLLSEYQLTMDRKKDVILINENGVKKISGVMTPSEIRKARALY